MSITPVPCNSTIGACAYGYNITMASTDTISNMALSLGGNYTNTATWAGTNNGSKGTPTWHTSQPFAFSYTPHAGATGTDNLTWQVTSQCTYGPSCSSASPGQINITFQSSAPTVANTSITTAYNTQGSVTLSGSGSISSYTISYGTSHGYAVISGSTAYYTPNSGYIGTDSFQYYATGPGGNSNIATVYVTVNPPAAPSVGNGLIYTNYNTTGSTAVSSSGVVSAFAVATQPAHGAASISGSTAFYTPNSGYIGTDSFTFYANGPGGNSNIGTVYITVYAPPAPTANGGSITTAYNTTGTTGISASGYVNAYGVCSNPSHGAAAVSGSTAYYTPNSGYIGADSFTIYANGPGGNSNCATISVTVQAPPAPSAANGSITTPYNTAATVTLPGSGVISSYAVVSGPSHGTASVSGSSVTYTPTAGYIGADSFTYHAVGPGGTSNTATISVTVQAPPAPTASNGALSVPYNTAGSTTLAASGVISSYAIVAQPAHGSVSLSGSTATYTPTSGYTGSDAFTFHVTGPGGVSNTATVSVTVLTPPSPNNGSLTVPFNTAGHVTLTGSGTISAYTIVAQPSHGAVTVSGSTATYTPTTGYYGSDSFTFRVSGPSGTSPTVGTIAVTVSLPPAPTAIAGSMTVPYQTATAATLQGSGVISAYAIVTQPSHGTVSLSGATATYTPAARYIGADSFTFRVSGPGGTSAPATEAVTVQAPPPPTGNSASITCPYQQTCTTTITSSGYADTYQVATQAGSGTCSISGNVLTYTPAWGAVGSDSCTFTATGPGGTSAPATVYITNQPPPLPDPGGSTGNPEVAVGGTATAICIAGQSTSFPVLPPAPTGTAYDPNWCDEQAVNIAEQAQVVSGQMSTLAKLQQQLAQQQQMVQSLGSDSTSAPLAAINSKLSGILNQAAGIGFRSQAAGSAFANAYPATSTTAGFNGAQLSAAVTTWQTNTNAALQNSIALQNAIAQQQGQVTGAVQNAVNASNAAAGTTAAHQATNQIIAAVTTQLTQLQDILLAQSQAYTAVQASKQQAAATAAAAGAQTQTQRATTVTSPPGVTDTSHM